MKRATDIYHRWVAWAEEDPTYILNGKMELGKAAFFTTDYTDFNGFHGEYARVLSKESLTQQVNSMKSITHS